MRYLFAVTTLIFSLFLFETSNAVQTNPSVVKSSSYTAKKISGPVIKAKICYGKALLETITSIPHLVKKSSSVQFFFNGKAEKNKDLHILRLKLYAVCSAYSYDYIFDFLYPKHVFW